jgi:hypothetical protein
MKWLEIKRFFVAIVSEVKMISVSIILRYNDKHIYCGHHNSDNAYHNLLKHVSTFLCKVIFRTINTTDRQN